MKRRGYSADIPETKMRLLKLLAATSAVLSCALATPGAHAQNYPVKPIKLVVPYPPSGIGDTAARDIALNLAQRLGQPVIVENKPGASQMIGAEFVAKSPADGYTLFLGSLSSLVLNISAQKNLPYDPFKDFAPVSLAFTTPLYLVVNPSLPVKSVADLIAYARGNPGKLSFGSIGAGSSLHLTAEMFKSMTGTDMVHIPYKGSMPALSDLVGGQIQLVFDVGTSALPLVHGGRLRMLAVTSKTRASGTPDIPPIADTVPGFDASFWFGIVAPAGVPQPIIDKLSTELRAILRQPALREKFRSNGVELTGSTPAEMTAQMKADLPIWQEVQRKAGISPE